MSAGLTAYVLRYHGIHLLTPTPTLTPTLTLPHRSDDGPLPFRNRHLSVDPSAGIRERKIPSTFTAAPLP